MSNSIYYGDPFKNNLFFSIGNPQLTHTDIQFYNQIKRNKLRYLTHWKGFKYNSINNICELLYCLFLIVINIFFMYIQSICLINGANLNTAIQFLPFIITFNTINIIFKNIYNYYDSVKILHTWDITDYLIQNVNDILDTNYYNIYKIQNYMNFKYSNYLKISPKGILIFDVISLFSFFYYLILYFEIVSNINDNQICKSIYLIYYIHIYIIISFIVSKIFIYCCFYYNIDPRERQEQQQHINNSHIERNELKIPIIIISYFDNIYNLNTNDFFLVKEEISDSNLYDEYNNNNNIICGICYKPLNDNIVSVFECKHILCMDCYNLCIKNKNYKCPFCMKKLTFVINF